MITPSQSLVLLCVAGGSMITGFTGGWTTNEYWAGELRAEVGERDFREVEGWADDLRTLEREFARVQSAVCRDPWARSQIIRVQAEQPSSPILCAGKP